MSRLLFVSLALLLAGCASPEPYTYHFIPGRTAELREGYAIPPPNAPEPVLAAIAAGNRIAGSPYSYGGGHRTEFSNGYDCSGATSFVLRAAGLMSSSTTSRGFRQYGESGAGRWITLHARRDHVFLVIAGLRFDTGYTPAGPGNHGPAWTTKTRPTDGAVQRHPRGL